MKNKLSYIFTNILHTDANQNVFFFLCSVKKGAEDSKMVLPMFAFLDFTLPSSRALINPSCHVTTSLLKLLISTHYLFLPIYFIYINFCTRSHPLKQSTLRATGVSHDQGL